MLPSMSDYDVVVPARRWNCCNMGNTKKKSGRLQKNYIGEKSPLVGSQQTLLLRELFTVELNMD